MRNFEFRRTSVKDKVILYGVRGVVMGLIFLAIGSLATQDSLVYQIRATANICICIWMYCNLVQAKVDIQELFVPPFNIRHGLEFLAIGGILHPLSFFV